MSKRSYKEMPGLTMSAPAGLRLLSLFLVLLSFGCRPKQEKPPVGLLNKEQMTQVLIQTHLLEADLEFHALPADSAKAIFQREEKKILDKAGVSEERFRKSYDFYLRNPRYMDVIYAAVVDSLSLREALTTQRETQADDVIMAPEQTPPAQP